MERDAGRDAAASTPDCGLPRECEARLLDLALSPGALEPAFNPSVTDYTLTIGTADTEVRVIAMSTPDSTIRVDGEEGSGAEFDQEVPLDPDVDSIQIEVVGASDVYTVTLDRVPVLERARLNAMPTQERAAFGVSVAIDNDTLVAGSWLEDDERGAVYVFRLEGGEWMQTARLQPSMLDAEDFFGFRVAVSGDTVAVGARGEGSATSADPSNNDAPVSGAAFVFRDVDGAWEQEAYLKADNVDEYDFFGFSVALHGDMLAVGAPAEGSGAGVSPEDNSLASAGAVYVFARGDDGWTQEAYLKAESPSAYDLFGTSVALDGDRVVVGSLGDEGSREAPTDDVQDHTGAAFVFARRDGDWVQEAYLKAEDPVPGSSFGISVAVDGTRICVGAPSDSATETDVGAAYIFDYEDDAWEQAARLSAAPSRKVENFGIAVSVAGDRTVVGAPNEVPNDRPPTDNGGGIYVFDNRSGDWGTGFYVQASDAVPGSRFGMALAMSSEWLVVGSDWATFGPSLINPVPFAGAVYVFR